MISFAVCIIGLLVWFIGSYVPKMPPMMSEIGRLMFFAGMLAYLLTNKL